jgi:hypothetical protein
MLLAASASAPLALGQIVPTQESPANGATGLPTTVTVRWVHYRAGETYRVQVFRGSTPIVDATVQNATGYTLFGLAKGATYTWRVNASKYGRTSAWSPLWKFTITTESAPAGPVLLSPPNRATGVPIVATFVWQPVAGATSYDLQVAPEPGFWASVVEWYAYPATSATASVEEAYTTRLYWRVRARNAGGVSAWSETWQFDVQ